MDIYTWTKPSKDVNSKPKKSKLEPGVTMIIGSNGVGKTTFLNQVYSIFSEHTWEKISKNDLIRDLYGVYLYSNDYEEKFACDSWLNGSNSNKCSLLASYHEGSEGQNMMLFLEQKMYDIGNFVRKCRQGSKKGVILLFDGLDSGLSPDNINIIKTQLLDFIVKEENKLNDEFEVYILCTSNSYELCSGYRCYSIGDYKYKNVSSYEEFVSNF